MLASLLYSGSRSVRGSNPGSCAPRTLCRSMRGRKVELRFSPSRDPICPSYPIIAWDEADSRGSLRNIVEPSYPVGYIGSLYLLDGSGWPLSPPPSSDLLVAVFIVVTACLPTWHRFASARRGVLFVYPQRLSSSPYPHPARPLHLALRICATPKRSCSTSTRVRCAAPPLVRSTAQTSLLLLHYEAGHTPHLGALPGDRCGGCRATEPAAEPATAEPAAKRPRLRQRRNHLEMPPRMQRPL